MRIADPARVACAIEELEDLNRALATDPDRVPKLANTHPMRGVADPCDDSGEFANTLAVVKKIAHDLTDSALRCRSPQHLSHAIFRPSIISGPENRPIRTLARLHRWSPVVPVFGDGRFPTQPVWIGDVALAFALAAERPTLGGVFELGGPAALTYEELVRAIGRAAGQPRPLVHVPLPIARAAAAAFGILGPLAPFTRDQLQMLVEGSATPANALESAFGIRALPFEEGLTRFLGGGAR